MVVRATSLWLDNGLCVVWRQTRRAIVEPTRADDGHRNCIVVDKLLQGPASSSAAVQVHSTAPPLFASRTTGHHPWIRSAHEYVLYPIAARKMQVRCQRERQPTEEAPSTRSFSSRLCLTMRFCSDTQEGDKLVSVTIGEKSTMVIGSSMLELRRMLERLDGGQVSTGHHSPITIREDGGTRQLHRHTHRHTHTHIERE